MHFTRLYPDRTPINFKAIFCDAKSLKCLAPRAGFEPATNRLTAGCSTAELPGNDGCPLGVSAVAYNKAAPALKA